MDITMSTTGFGLPTSLTPDMLKRILRYEPRHWRALKPHLVKERPTDWKNLQLSDDDFYTKLHALLRDPSHRQALHAAAQKVGTKSRPLTLCQEIHKHYARSLRNTPSFFDRLPENATSREIVGALADCDDDDLLTNVVWALAEEGHFTCLDLSAIANDHPGVRTRLVGTAKGVETESMTVAARWIKCLSMLKEMLEVAEKNGPDPEVATHFVDCAHELQELALESDRAAKARASLANIIDKHRDVLSDHDPLKPYISDIAEGLSTHALLHNVRSANELVEELDKYLHSLALVADSIREKSAAMRKANAEERNRLIEEMGKLQNKEMKACSETERLLARLVPGAESDLDSMAPEEADEATEPRKPQQGRDDEASEVTAFGLGPPEVFNDIDEATGSPERTASSITGNTGSPGDESVTASNSLPKMTDLKDDTGLTETPEVPAAAQGHEGAPESPSDRTTLRHEDGQTASCSAIDAPHQISTPSSESEALDAMLSSGRFARAYWLARADRSLGDPDLLGGLCEGSRIGPGKPCPGILTQLFDVLAGKDSWTDDERLLLCAAVLSPCLFLDPLPQGIYQLANQFPVEGSPVGPLMQRVRDLCVYQNTKILPENLDVESVDSIRDARLDDLASAARDFLVRVPHIRFTYAPADRALQFLYRTGSEWHRLHTIVGENRSTRLREARALVKTLDPMNVAASIHDETELTALKTPLEGRARDKLTRHLHDTIGRAGEWIRLTETNKSGGETTSENRSEELRCVLDELLPAARNALNPSLGRGPVDALHAVLEDVEARIRGRVSQERTALSQDLLLLPNLPLEDDLEPADSDLDSMRHAILETEQSEPNPKAVFDECLNRHEYRRAREILYLHEIGSQARDEYERAVKSERSRLATTLNELELEIENAFLLGQLPGDVEQGEPAGDPNHNSLQRSRLLSVVREATNKLHTMSTEPEADGLREITRAVEEVSNKVRDLALSRREQLRHEFDDIMHKLPDTEQGRADREYLREAFEECSQKHDDVAAFDLLDRGWRAAQGIEPITRASIGSNASLAHFLTKADGYREALTGKRWLPQIERDIAEGSTVAGIAFGQLDRTRRSEAASGLRTWNCLFRLRFPGARDELKNSMGELLRFIGLPIADRGVHVADITEAGFAHVRVDLARPVLSSPLPAFGSACGSRFEIVVSQTRKEPQQVEEYIIGRGLADKPILVYLLPPESPAYRLRWLRHCVRSRLTALPLDFTLFLHLCGVRNRLPILLEVGLPFTWSCPYITKGENVAAEMFVGRSDEAATLMTPTGSCIVFGGRQLGKSALLRHVHRENHNPGTSTFITYLDVDELGSDSQDHDTMMAAFWRRVYDELHRDGALPALPQRILSRESRLVDEVPRSISTRLSESENMRIVLLLDESDDVLDCDSGRDFTLVRRLRGLMAGTGRRFKVIFAGLQSVQRYNNWENHPFAQLGSELVVNPLPPAAAQELIIRPLRALGFAFERAGLILRILSQTNYHPGLIQIICYRLLENLYAKLLRQEHDGPIRRITDEDILRVERDAAVMEDIRNRFDWTLDLDDRYKVLTYALVLTLDPPAPRLEAEFMSIGASWWPAVFETMDAQSLRAILDEMVGLGVLLREHEHDEGGRRRYRLRSPNLLRLLGPQEAIESELERIITRDHVSRANPRNYRPLIDRKPVAFGPLTNEQEGRISKHSRPFHLSIVSGNDALGLGQVERQIDRLLGEIREGEKHLPWKKIAYSMPTRADPLLQELRKALTPRRRRHRYAIFRLKDIEFEGQLATLFDRFVRELGQVCTNESKGHVVILLGPSDTWRWLGDEHRERVLAQSRVTGLALRRWSDGAIANAFDRLDARTGSKAAGTKVFEMTSGFHQLVDEGLRRAKPKQNAVNFIGKWNELRDEALSKDGIEAAQAALGLRGPEAVLETCVWEVLRLTEVRDGEPLLVETSFDLAVEEVGEKGRALLEDSGNRVKEWIRTMDLARPKSGREDGAMVVASWVQEVLTTAGT